MSQELRGNFQFPQKFLRTSDNNSPFVSSLGVNSAQPERNLRSAWPHEIDSRSQCYKTFFVGILTEIQKAPKTYTIALVSHF